MHDPEDRCFYCMSEAEFHRSSVGSSEPPHAVEPGAPQPGMLAAVRALADRWANQGTDWDEDTEQQIHDGWTLRALLDSDAPGSVDFDALALQARSALSESRYRRLDDIDDDYLTPSSPADSAPGGEAARPGPPHGDVGGPGRATNSPQEK
jgi:hypothetical protein